MGITPRSVVTPAPTPAPRQPARLPPTQSQLSLAAYRLADELGGRALPQAERDNAAGEIYDFAAGSVATAWSCVEAADMAVRCLSGRRKVSGARGEIVGPFRAELDKAKAEDLAHRGEILTAMKAEGADKPALEGELRELTLQGRKLLQGRPLRLGPAASAYLLDAMRREFLPVKGSPLAVEDFPQFVGGNLRFLDWLGTALLFSETQVSEYEAAKEADKAVRAAVASSPAPEEAVDAEEGVEEAAESA